MSPVGAGGACFSTLVLEQPVNEEIGPFSGLLECRTGSLLKSRAPPPVLS